MFHINFFAEDKKICSSVTDNIFLTPRNLLLMKKYAGKSSEMMHHEIICLHFQSKENMAKKWEILGKINLDRKVLKGGFNFLSTNQKCTILMNV